MATEDGTRRATSGRRSDVLLALKSASEPLSINDIADRLRVHPNTVRFHLEALVEAGRVERVRSDRRGTGRPPLFFRPVRGMDPTGPRRYQLLAEVLATGLAADPDRGARALEAGRAWGRRIAERDDFEGADFEGADLHGAAASTGGADRPGSAVDQRSAASTARLMTLLDEVGFAPERGPDSGSTLIGLRHCPFLELAEVRSEIVCPVHLGLMQGAMEAWHSPLGVDRLEPFVEPDLCVAHLSSR